MKCRRLLMGSGFLSVLVVLSLTPTRADLHLRFPADIEPDFYQSGGPIGSLHDGEWVAIPFWRSPELIPEDFNLIDTFDANAIGLPLLVEGFLRLGDTGPPSWEARGLGAVPFWFVHLSELEAAAADGELTIGELSALDSLVTGSAGFYQEQNHIFGIHPVSHYTLVSSGMLHDGRSFDVRFVETNLRFLQTRICAASSASARTAGGSIAIRPWR